MFLTLFNIRLSLFRKMPRRGKSFVAQQNQVSLFRRSNTPQHKNNVCLKRPKKLTIRVTFIPWKIYSQTLKYSSILYKPVCPTVNIRAPLLPTSRYHILNGWQAKVLVKIRWECYYQPPLKLKPTA